MTPEPFRVLTSHTVVLGEATSAFNCPPTMLAASDKAFAVIAAS